jgi:O-antigen/teichoic acid export membrane protein
VERIKRAGLTGISSVLAQGITIVAGFISVPLTVGYLGKERYGIWLAINSLLQWLYVSNLGLSGNALINKLSEANGKDDKNLAQELVSTAFWMLGGLSAIFLLLFAVSFSFINWQWIFNTTEVSPNELQWAVIFAFICFVMMFPTSMVDAVYGSYQEGYIGNIWNIAGSIFSLIALIIVTQIQGGLPLLVASLFGVRMLFSFFNAGYLFFIRHPWLKPLPGAVTKKSFRGLRDLGFAYLTSQLSSISLIQSQPFILIQILGPASVALFSITQRIIFLPSTFLQMFVFPLMPAYGEAKARGDIRWIRKTLKYSLLFISVAALLSLSALIFTAHPIINIWVGKDFLPSNLLIIAFATHAFIGNLITPLSVMLYGLEKVKAQAAVVTLNAIVSIPLGIFMTQQSGEVGLALAMVTAMILTNVIGLLILLRYTLKNELKD